MLGLLDPFEEPLEVGPGVVHRHVETEPQRLLLLEFHGVDGVILLPEVNMSGTDSNGFFPLPEPSDPERVFDFCDRNPIISKIYTISFLFSTNPSSPKK